MLGQYTLENNVRVVLHDAITAVSNTIRVDAATGLFRNPPNPSGDAASGGVAIATLQDATIPPTKTEIITYTSIANNGDGTFTLGGVARGAEGTTPQSFAAGAVLFQAATAGQSRHPYVEADQIDGVLNFAVPTRTLGSSGLMADTKSPILCQQMILSGVGASPTEVEFRVSADGTSFTTAWSVNLSNGGVSIPAIVGDVAVLGGLSIGPFGQSLDVSTQFGEAVIQSGSVLRIGAQDAMELNISGIPMLNFGPSLMAVLSRIAVSDDAYFQKKIDAGGRVVGSTSVNVAAPTTALSNWTFTGIADAGIVRLTGTGGGSLSGIAGGTGRRTITFVNATSSAFSFLHATTSIPQNRFALPGSVNLSLSVNDSVTFWYDADSAVWRVLR